VLHQVSQPSDTLVHSHSQTVPEGAYLADHRL
jgi:hypothetical protein